MLGYFVQISLCKMCRRLSFNSIFAARRSIPVGKNSDTKSRVLSGLLCIDQNNDCVVRAAIITVNIKVHPTTLF